MKTIRILLAALLGCIALSASAERVIPRNLFGEDWHRYCYQSKGDLGIGVNCYIIA